MSGSVSGRRQGLDLLAKQIGARVAEQLLGLRIDEDDAALLVDDDDGVGGRFEKIPELLFGLPALAGVARDLANSDQRSAISVDGCDDHFRPKKRSISAHAPSGVHKSAFGGRNAKFELRLATNHVVRG